MMSRSRRARATRTPRSHASRVSPLAVRTTGRPALVSQREHINRKEPDVAGKKRPKSLAQTGTKAPAKAKRPKKTSRGK
jgi:hypothetical protein